MVECFVSKELNWLTSYLAKITLTGLWALSTDLHLAPSSYLRQDSLSCRYRSSVATSSTMKWTSCLSLPYWMASCRKSRAIAKSDWKTVLSLAKCRVCNRLSTRSLFSTAIFSACARRSSALSLPSRKKLQVFFALRTAWTGVRNQAFALTLGCAQWGSNFS